MNRTGSTGLTLRTHYGSRPAETWPPHRPHSACYRPGARNDAKQNGDSTKDRGGARRGPRQEINMRNVEPLESRRLLASFTASSVTDLIADINAANAAGGTNTITL